MHQNGITKWLFQNQATGQQANLQGPLAQLVRASDS